MILVVGGVDSNISNIVDVGTGNCFVDNGASSGILIHGGE